MMADRVHPRDSPPPSHSSSMSTPTHSGEATKPPYPTAEKPVPPPPGTYIVQVPKDQIYRYPPPGNSKRYQSLIRGKHRRSCCRRCCCFFLVFFLILVIAAGIAAGVFYLVFKPESPKYTVSSIAIRGLNVTSTRPISPEFDVGIRAENPNDKLGIYYLKGSSVKVVYSGVDLVTGGLPTFFQPKNNVTVFKTPLKGSNIVLSSSLKSGLTSQARQKKVPLKLKVKMPVKIKVGAVKTWKLTVKVNCDVTVDALNEKSNIVSKDCDYDVKLW